jgi:hypothetical protein
MMQNNEDMNTKLRSTFARHQTKAQAAQRYDVLIVDVLPHKRMSGIGAMMKHNLPHTVTLKEAMLLTFRLPSTIMCGVPLEKAQTMELIFEFVGATVAIRPSVSQA